MDIKEILREFTRRDPSNMSYHDEEEAVVNHLVFGYLSFVSVAGQKWRIDRGSSVMLRFKQGHSEVIGYYLLKILDKFGRQSKYREAIEDSNLQFAIVFGHEMGKDESSVHKLARMLSAYYGCADYSRCLYNRIKLSVERTEACWSSIRAWKRIPAIWYPIRNFYCWIIVRGIRTPYVEDKCGKVFIS